jgi:hypothetical protein
MADLTEVKHGVAVGWCDLAFPANVPPNAPGETMGPKWGLMVLETAAWDPKYGL